MTKLPEEYEGDIYRYSHEGLMGAYICGNNEGGYGLISFGDYYLALIEGSLRGLLKGDRCWSVSPVDEYVVPKEFLM